MAAARRRWMRGDRDVSCLGGFDDVRQNVNKPLLGKWLAEEESILRQLGRSRQLAARHDYNRDPGQQALTLRASSSPSIEPGICTSVTRAVTPPSARSCNA